MGLFNRIFVSANVAGAWRVACPACGAVPDPTREWQTKSLDRCMSSYALRHDERGAIRLYALDRPTDRRFWRAWTDEEIAESEAHAKEDEPLAKLWLKRRGEGRWLPEAFLPQHRRHRFMGELPHQWVEIHDLCRCDEFIVRWIKFGDGIATATRCDPPKLDFVPEGDLFD